jgi:threonine dehydratase
MTALPVTIAEVRAAEEVVAGAVMRTPLAPSQTLSAITGAEVFVKFENLQFTASFKERGARNRLHHLTAGERTRGVVAASAGNHAQGVAHHANLLGIPATIVMPQATPANKVHRTRVLGAEVVLDGDSFEAAAARAEELVRDQGLTLVHPFADPLVIAGQGTVGLEILADQPDLEIVVVPIGGGGLFSGVATAVKALRPDVRVIGVQSELFPWAADARSAGAVVRRNPGRPIPPTVAEGIAVKSPHPLTAAFIDALVDDVVVVSEDAIEEAVCLFLDVEKVVAEGAGAAPLAALLAQPATFAGRRCALVLTGGNVDLRLLATMAMRSMTRSGRLVRLRVVVNDLPGTLATVVGVIAARGGNIVDLSHLRHQPWLPSRRAELDVEIEFSDSADATGLVDDLVALGYDVLSGSD